MKKLMNILFAVIVFCSSAVAQQAATSKPDAATLNFIEQASLGGMKEVKAGQLATQKGQSPSVKAFGARMVTDHTKANAQLMSIVKTKGWSVTPPSNAETAPDAMLTNSSGAAFDKNYVTMMVGDHEKTVALFQTAASSATDAQIKAFAQATLPILKQHLDAIKAIAAKIK